MRELFHVITIVILSGAIVVLLYLDWILRHKDDKED